MPYWEWREGMWDIMIFHRSSPGNLIRRIANFRVGHVFYNYALYNANDYDNRVDRELYGHEMIFAI